MINKEFKFNVALKRLQQEGNLAWEYNPFRNYRLNRDMIFYKNLFYDIEKFNEDFVLITLKTIEILDDSHEREPYEVDVTIEFDLDSKVYVGYYFKLVLQDGEWHEEKVKYDMNWYDLGFDPTEEVPVVYLEGLLVDFITDDTQFDFDLNHPVQITPTYSYDNSVDLIINDGKSLPKIINSRFSAIGKNKYKIVDRTGNNDTNIYDMGDQFAIDTSLYKITSLIPTITFGGEAYGGNLKVGNYHFYFKYSDLDGNESDFVALSGLVSIFLGNTPSSINSGFRDLNSNKRVRFILSDIDKAYDYIIVYYSRATSLEYENRTTEYARILHRYKVSSSINTIIDITGFEDTVDSTFEEINLRLQIYDSAKTLAVSLNMLFLGNTTLSYLDHDLLSRLALYIIPSYNTKQNCNIQLLSHHYSGDTSKTYYNPNFIYNYTGYWDDEIYRFGVVFIRNNNTLTPVYNVRGLYLNDSINESKYKETIRLTQDGDIENLITYDETTYLIDSEFMISLSKPELENAKGVCYIPVLDSLEKVIGVTFLCSNHIINKLESLGIKGYFIVRLKRIPTTLCLAYTIGLESESHTPMLPVGNNEYKYESFLDEEETSYTYFDEDARRKTDKGNLLSNSFRNHIRTAPKGSVTPKAAICPDYDVNSAYLNTLFSGQDFVVTTYYLSRPLTESSERLFTVNLVNKDGLNTYTDVKIIGVEDNVKLVGIDDTLFSARAGEAEEAFRYASVGAKVKKDHGGANLLRGSFGPYLGITGYSSAGDLITIKIPGYNPNNMVDYFKIRFEDASMFYPISDRLTFNSLKKEEIFNLGTHYRGDCYICKFTHRLNRNFSDAQAPTNDDIIDPTCWTHNLNFEDEVLKTDDLDKINLGDVNAVNLGMWVSFIVRSNINHSVRSLDLSQVDEAALMGNCRGFYPYHPISARAAYKLPESGTYNKGFEASVGELIFEELPIVPYYKDVFSTRIAYSNLLISTACENAYRVFQASHFLDYPITYGEITKIVEWDGDLICVLEHGIYRIPINERAVAGEGSGGNVYINTSNVLPKNPIVISDTFGSLWIDSIIKTPSGIYGVDTVAKKIWKVDSSGIAIISDSKIQEFLNNNITLTERELTPIIGIRNVKTHYNAFKHDVMFTFYDDLNGVDEVAWNLCWNESMGSGKWITFYSWIPSFSENIHNTYFSFDRETSRHIALLALNEKSDYNDYIYLKSTVIEENTNSIGELHYDIDKEDIIVNLKWEIVKDPYLNYRYFEFSNNSSEFTGKNPTLCRKGEYKDYTVSINSEKYNSVEYDDTTYTLDNGEWYSKKGKVDVDSLISLLFKERKKKWKNDFEEESNESIKPSEVITKRKVYLINIRVTPTFEYSGSNASYAEFVANQNANIQLTGGSIERTIAVIPRDHLETLSTDFWKHGQAGIIDITEDILPTKWYGKLHPFEFEFVVRENAGNHKIFDNLVILSNKAEPESFHYEIVGQCYDFAKDKKNMYIRQEATKELFLNEGYNISFNDNYKSLDEYHRPIEGTNYFDKSTIFPAYYYRKDKINTILDYYNLRPGENGKDFSGISGSEIVYYKTLNEFRIWLHLEGINMADKGRLRGNMHYKEDLWYVLIPSINLVLKNEPSWTQTDYGNIENKDNIPVELLLANFVKAPNFESDNPISKDRGVVLWLDNLIRRSEAKLKDRYVKIRIRYSGEDLAVISAIKTLYSISYA